MSNMYIYKVLTEDEWSMASKSNEIITDLDQKDGFIHCSQSDQLALTLHLFFKEQSKLILLQIDSKKFKENLLFEDANLSNRKGKFPHLYGKLNIQNICKSWGINRNAFELPEEILIEAEQ